MNKMMNWWAGDACTLVTRSMWTKKSYGQRVIFGYGAWFLALMLVFWAYFVLKGALWVAICCVLVTVNLSQLLVGCVVAPFAYLFTRERKPRAMRTDPAKGPRRGHTTAEVEAYYRSLREGDDTLR